MKNFKKRVSKRRSFIALFGTLGILSGIAIASPSVAAADSACPPASTIAAEDLPRYDGCELEGALIVFPSGIEMTAPPRGVSVEASALTSDGVDIDATLVATASGGIAAGVDDEVLGATDEAAAAEIHDSLTTIATPDISMSAAATTKCASSAPYVLKGYQWQSKHYKWWYNGNGNPGTGAATRITDAAAYVTAGRSTQCGNLKSKLSIDYQHSVSKKPAVNTTGGCGTYSSDGVNVVGWGSLPNTMLAVTCSWRSGSSMLKADIMFDNTSRSWWVNSAVAGCQGTGSYDVQGIATHEFGHAVGLGHVAQASGQVMKPQSGGCEGSQRQLGRGDQRGLVALYGAG